MYVYINIQTLIYIYIYIHVKPYVTKTFNQTSRNCYKLELKSIHQRGVFFSLASFHSVSVEPDNKTRFFKCWPEYAENRNNS